jgi:hypothetical protein
MTIEVNRKEVVKNKQPLFNVVAVLATKLILTAGYCINK